MKTERRNPATGGREATAPRRSPTSKPQPQTRRKPAMPGPNKTGRDQDRDGIVGSENDDPGRG